MPGVMLFVLVIQMKYVVDIMITSIQILFLEQDCELFFYFLIVIVSCFFLFLEPRLLLMVFGQNGVIGGPVIPTV